ncbi:MAG: AAA family ATPase [Oscillospiraceae bacterium]|nr:AAA family ATPase [Oscillospiraceae bacterium]
MKIHIIGGPGSGKSFLAERLSRELGIPHYDLDDLQWDNTARGYGTKRDPQERDALLQEILQQQDWIIEGVYYAWCDQSFRQADQIYLLQVPRRLFRFRILRRFVRRKLGLEPGKKETLKSLRALLKWADKYQRKNLPEIQKILEPYGEKLITSDVNNWRNEQ